jgi:hypothetical protein
MIDTRSLTLSAAIAMLLGVGVGLPEPSAAQAPGAAPTPAAIQTPDTAPTPAACGPFRVEWHRGVLSPTGEKLEGFVYNDSTCVVTDVRIRVVAVDASDHPIAETQGWVFGDIAPGASGYFALSPASAPAAGYRISVISFDEVATAR